MSEESGEKKRSWRESSSKKKPAPAAAPAETPAPEPVSEAASSPHPPAAPRRAARFTGGKSYGRNDSLSKMVNAVLGLVGLAVVAALIVVLIRSLEGVGPSGARPVLAAWAVTDYKAPIPANAFALRDLGLIRRGKDFAESDHFKVDTSNMQTQDQFRTFFESALPNLKDETVIIYVNAHGVSDKSGGYLLHNESGADPKSGYPLRKVIEEVARCPAKNRLLILDATKIESNLELGLLGNDFAYHLKQDFERVKKELDAEDPPRSFWVLCSSAEGQRAWSSPNLNHSFFGIAVGYCLRGGKQADLPDEKNETDSRIQANELVEYVKKRVPAWVGRYRDAAQTPIDLRVGPDFDLVRTDDATTLTSLSEEEDSPAENADGASAAAGKEGEDAKKEEAPAPKKEEKPAPAKKPAETAVAKAIEKATAVEPSDKPIDNNQVKNRIMSHWELSRNPVLADIPMRRPDEWASFQEILMRAEALLVAGEMNRAVKLLDEDVARLIGKWGDDSNWPALPPWSISARDPENEKDPLAADFAAIDAFVKKPEDPKTIEKLEQIEARELRLLAQHCLKGKEWANPQAINDALATRQAAENAARLPNPFILSMVRDQIEAGDAHRREGMVAVLMNRQYAGNFSLAREQYRLARERAADLDRQLVDAQKMVNDLPYLIRWIAADPGRERSTQFPRALAEFQARLFDFSNDPTPAAFQGLVASSDQLRQVSTGYGQTAWQVYKWQGAWAALQIPFLDLKTRAGILSDVLGTSDAVDARDESPPVEDARQPANPFPLHDFVKQVNPSDEKLVGLFKKFEPTGTNVISLKACLSSPTLLSERAEAGAGFQQMVATLPVESAVAVGRSNLIGKNLRRRLLSAFRAARGAEASPSADSFEQIYRLALAEQADWLRRRFEADAAVYPDASVIAPIVARMSQEGRRLGGAPSDSASGVAHFALEGDGQFKAPPGETITTSLRIRALRDVPRGQRAKLVLDWKASGSRLNLAVADTSAQDREAELELVDIGPEKPADIAIEIERTDRDRTPIPPPMARIERSSDKGSLIGIDWFPLTISDAPPQGKEAQIVVAGLPSQNEIVLFPNQSLGFSLRVKKNVPEKMQLRLEIDGDGPRRLPIPLEMKEGLDVTETVSAALLKQPLAIVRDQLRINLFMEGEAKPIDSKLLRIDILRPSAFLDVSREAVNFDIDKREVSVRVSRTAQQSHSQESVPLELDIPRVPSGPGQRTGSLRPDQREAILTRIIPPDISSGELDVNVAVCGVPRALRFRLDASSGVRLDAPKLAIRIKSPAPNFKFDQSPPFQIPVGIMADGPIGREVQLEVGFDGDDNDEFDAADSASRTFTYCRDVAVELAAASDPPQFTVLSRVADITIPIRCDGIGKQTIMARLVDGDQREDAEVSFYVLGDATPDVAVVRPNPKDSVAQKSPLQVDLVGDPNYYGAIDEVLFAFAPDANWDAAKPILPLDVTPGSPLRFEQGPSLSVRLPTDSLPVGPTTLMVRAKTNVGTPEKPVARLGRVQYRTIEIAKEMAGEPEKPKTGKLVVVVEDSAGTKETQAKVVVAGLDKPPVQQGNRFTFVDVPPMKYQITATTTKRKGAAVAEVKAGDEATVVKVVVSL